ncbi:MAG: hypothetical protein ACRDJ0_05635 [Actinomycetota bacterium]
MASGDGNDSIAGVENAIGSDHDDVITGDSGDNRLSGGPAHFAPSQEEPTGLGNDTISGEGGNDVILGGLDDDEMHGGTGTDMLVFVHIFAPEVGPITPTSKPGRPPVRG